MKKSLILVSAALFAISCTNDPDTTALLEERVAAYEQQHIDCLDDADGMTEIRICQDIFDRQIDAEFRELNRRLEDMDLD